MHCKALYSTGYHCTASITTQCPSLHSVLHCTVSITTQCPSLHSVLRYTVSITTQCPSLHSVHHCTRRNPNIFIFPGQSSGVAICWVSRPLYTRLPCTVLVHFLVGSSSQIQLYIPSKSQLRSTTNHGGRQVEFVFAAHSCCMDNSSWRIRLGLVRLANAMV